MRKLLAALGLLGGLWASNVTATILSYDVTVTSGDWLIGDLRPFGVASQPTFSGALKVNNAYSDGTALVGFNMVTGSQTWTEKSLASSNAASFSFNSAGNLSNFGITLGNVMTDSLAINSSGFSLTESKTNTTTGQYLAYGVACSNCVSFAPTRPPPPVQAPTNYGLFIGIKDEAQSLLGTRVTLRDDKTATNLANAFHQMPNSKAYLITRDLTIGEQLTEDDVKAQLSLIRGDPIRPGIRPGDTLVVYIGSHGSSYTQSFQNGAILPTNTSNDIGRGNEYLYAGNNAGFGLGQPGLTDKALTSLLKGFDDVNVMAFIDACHSGGFWASGDSDETSQNDLNSLANIALFAASSEEKRAWADSLSGQSFFGNSLELAWAINPISGRYFSDKDNDGVITLSEMQDFFETKPWLNNFPGFKMFETGFGAIVPFDADLIDFDYRATSGFAGALNVSSVPEPNSLALLATGFFVLFSRRIIAKRMKK